MIDQVAQTVVTNPDLSAQVANLNAVLTQISAFLSHVSVGGATAHGLEWLKGKPGVSRWWDLLTGRGKVIVGGVLAFMGSIGITAAFTHDPSQPGVYHIMLTGLTASSIGAHVWGFVQSWVLQQGWYASLIKPRAVSGATQQPGAAPKEQVPVPVVVELPKETP